jgi:hypothetical protein
VYVIDYVIIYYVINIVKGVVAYSERFLRLIPNHNIAENSKHCATIKQKYSTTAPMMAYRATNIGERMKASAATTA